MGTKSDLHNNRLKIIFASLGVLTILMGVLLMSSTPTVFAQTSTGTPMATAMPTAAATAVPTLAAPVPTASATALVPVTGADLSVQAAQQSLYVNLGIVSLGLVLVVIGILIRTNRKH